MCGTPHVIPCAQERIDAKEQEIAELVSDLETETDVYVKNFLEAQECTNAKEREIIELVSDLKQAHARVEKGSRDDDHSVPREQPAWRICFEEVDPVAKGGLAQKTTLVGE